MFLVIAPHVTDGVDRINDPQQRRQHGKQHAERFHLKFKGEPRKNFGHLRRWSCSGE